MAAARPRGRRERARRLARARHRLAEAGGDAANPRWRLARDFGAAFPVDRLRAVHPADLGPRLRLLLDAWPYNSEEQKDRLTAHMAETWRIAPEHDHRFMAHAVYGPADELILRYFLRDVPGAQEEITKLIMREQKR